MTLHWGNIENYTQPLTFIASYYGEKYGFYFAWLVNYTSFLLIPSILGLGFFIAQISTWVSENASKEEGEPKVPFYAALDHRWNVWYVAIMLIYSTGYVEGWKRM
jgi:hypothetical protein